MSTPSPPQNLSDPLHRLAGYLNFGSGVSDAGTRSAWNEVYDVATHGDPLSGLPAWLVVQDWISQTLDQLQVSQAAFQDTRQARRAIKLLWSDLLPAYLDFHRDLLFHQQPELLFNGFFMGRAADALLASGVEIREGLTDESIVQTAIDQIDDFVGYRPVAMLENRQCDPYRHEFSCPVPLYMTGAGVSAGPYRELIRLALEILAATDPSLLRAAALDPARIEELSLDPRAYDFDHPVNRRPNYHFGGWDERSITSEGYFNRFILRQVTLDALLSRLADEPESDRDELMVEAATVLVGTMLMASAISGWGPGAYTSDITLGSLMKPIATFRDGYYRDQMARIQGEHGKRLLDEQQRRHQPFGAARQHLNAAIAQRRAAQLQHVQLARLYARMGYPDAAKRQTDTVTAASARMMCRIECLMTLGIRQLRRGDLDEAVKVPEAAFDLIKRGIDCGAIIDPWDILGFGGNFNLYPGPESGVHDSRVDNLVYLTEQLFGYVARVWSEAAARDHQSAYDEMELRYREIAHWWRGYAPHTVESIDVADPLESYESAKLVARALRLWHQGGAAAGDVAFWAPHAELFDSPRAYALVIQALLEREDFVPAMALLVHWLGHADQVGLRSGQSSLPRLAERWLLKLRGSTETKLSYGEPSIDQVEPGDTRDVWPLARKFFDYLEANAEEFWSAPRFLLGQSKTPNRDWDVELTAMEDGDDEGLFDAAYEGMTYRDTTDDGNEGAIFEFGDEGSGDELEAESKRLTEHLDFLQSLARMWSVAADIAVTDQSDDDLGNRWESLQGWARRARENRIGLLELLDAVRGFQIAPTGSDKDSMRSYDRRRVLRDSLMERIIGTAVEMSDARRLISGAIDAIAQTTAIDRDPPDESMAEEDAQAIEMFAALIASDHAKAQKLFPGFLEAIRDKNLLYIPLARGGDPVKIYVARLRQRTLRHLMHWLPRRGLIAETCRLVETARQMEQSNTIGAGAVTEFDSLFQAGFRSLVASLVESTRQGIDDGTQSKASVEKKMADALIPLLERLTETMLASWLSHSQTLRLSPLETVGDPKKWQKLVDFIKAYGDPIFTQTFLQLGNVRAILHQGVGPWLQRAVQEGEAHFADTRLFMDLDIGKLKIDEAQRPMTLVYESLIDHHAEYVDYNSTTTQSDRGDLVYMFLDFLRLRVRYERIAWNLKPVMWAHEVLVRSGLENAATMWRRSLSDRIGNEAEVYVTKLRELQQTYAMRMPTVADRIFERFVQPMTIDRMRALIGPAMRDAESGNEDQSFQVLEREAELLTRHPTGIGLDAPAWLDALEAEVEQLTKRRTSSEMDPQSLMTIAIIPLSISELDDQLKVARNQGRRLPHMK